MNDFDIDDAEEGLSFNKYELDTAVSEHPELYYRVSEQLAQTSSLRDEAKKTLEETYALLSLKIREEAAYDGVKITEDAVRQKTYGKLEYQQEHSLYLKYKGEADKWQAMKEAYSQKGFMLRMMGDLYTTNYFSDISIKGGNLEEADNDMKRKKISRKRKPLPPRNR